MTGKRGRGGGDATRCDAMRRNNRSLAALGMTAGWYSQGRARSRRESGQVVSCPYKPRTKARVARQARRYTKKAATLGDGDVGAEVDVLDGVEELDAFFHGALESLPAGDEAGPATALVDDAGGHPFTQLRLTAHPPPTASPPPRHI